MTDKQDELTPEDYDKWYSWFVDILNRKPDEAEKNAIRHLLETQLAKTHKSFDLEQHRLNVEWAELAKQTVKQERGRIKTAKVICLCGSTRFTDQMLIKQWELTKQGYIVVTWCVLPESYFKGEDKTHIGDQEDVKDLVDEVHKRKLDLCDEVFILNINGYIGESTASEIAYAEKIGRPINYWQALKQGKFPEEGKD